MDVKQYYRKIYEVEAGITEQYPVVVSVETADGGKGGVLSEVPRALAAKMIVEGRAVLASPAEKDQYLEGQAAAKKLAEKAELTRHLQVAILSDTELKTLSSMKKNSDPADTRK